MGYDFDGRHVVVTGGTGALGTEVVRLLLDNGATCHVPAIDENEVKAFPFAGHARVTVTVGVDLTADDAVTRYFAGLPGLWASVHCAGGFGMSDITGTSLDDLQRLISLNIVTSYLCTREAIRTLRSGGQGGRVVNISAQPGIEPRNAGGLTAYSATKGAVASLTQSAADEVSSENIWVNAVAPSIMDTPANREAMPDAPHSDWPSTADVAATIAFLASPDNRVTRAAVVPVYGRS